MPSEDVVRVNDYRDLAAELLPDWVWNYIEGGAGDEHTLCRNESSWQEIELLPHALVDVSSLDTTVELLGHSLAHPVLIAPTASHALYHSNAELETLSGAASAEALAVMSTLGSTPVHDIGANATSPWWFQLYVQPDRGFTADLVARAGESGASALVLTVDTPVLGARDRDRRDGGHTVDGLHPPNLAPVSASPPDDLLPHQAVYNIHLDPSVQWQTLSWLVDISQVPVLVKGIVRSDDARSAVEHGAAGIIVSNHGARNLDTTIPTSRALPRVVEAVDDRVPVLVDGGIRRGTDVAKALCLGADGVMVGRPLIWGLATDGASGVAHVINLLRAELMMAMALLGAPTLADLGRDLLEES